MNIGSGTNRLEGVYSTYLQNELMDKEASCLIHNIKDFIFRAL